MAFGYVMALLLGGASVGGGFSSDGLDKGSGDDDGGQAQASVGNYNAERSDAGTKSVPKATDKKLVRLPPTEIERALLEKWEGIRSISARIMTHEEFSRGSEMISVAGGGFYHYKKSDGKNLTRVEILSDLPPGKDKPTYDTSTKLLTICDGRFLYHVAEQYGKKRVQKRSKKEVYAILMGGPRVFEYLREHFELSAGPEEMIDGRATYVIHCKPKAASGDARYYFDKQTGVMIRRIVEDVSVKRSQTFSLIKPLVNVEIEDSKFVFVPPEGVKVIDATGADKAVEESKRPKADAQK